MTKKIFIFCLVLMFFSSISLSDFGRVYARSSRTKASDVYVKGYYRKNGTYVQPYYRSKADGIVENNYSCIDDGRCGGSVSGVTATEPEEFKTEPSFLNSERTPLPLPSPSPTLSPAQLKEIECSVEKRSLNKKITSEERIKFSNVTMLRKLVSTLDGKQSTESANLRDQVENYRQKYDGYTNKLYEATWHACDLDSTLFESILDEQKNLYKDLAPLRISAQKFYSTALQHIPIAAPTETITPLRAAGYHL